MIAPISGANTINATMTKTPVGIAPALPSENQLTELVPACAIAAPAKPPIKV